MTNRTRAVRPGRDGGGQDVAGPRAADAQAGAEPAADAGVAVGHEPGPFLVRRHDRLRPGPGAQLGHQRVDMSPGHEEGVPQPLVAQAAQQELRTGHEEPPRSAEPHSARTVRRAGSSARRAR